VPNLDGRVQSVRCNEGRACSKEVHGVKLFWWASGLPSRACPPRFTTVTSRRTSTAQQRDHSRSIGSLMFLEPL
jgi:hypothetical protein